MRRWLIWVVLGVILAGFAPVKRGVPLVVPRDHGAHPAFRTEWWYVTGWLKTAQGADLGFQVTFFSHQIGGRQWQPEQVCAQPDHFCPCSDFRSQDRPFAPCTAHRARRLRAGGGKQCRYRCGSG